MTRPSAATSTAAQRLAGRTALVTGGGRGIGASIAQRLADEGASVLVATKTAQYGEETVRRIREAGGLAETICVELGKVSAVEAIIDRIDELWGKLDIIVHNAAYSPFGAVHELSDEDYERTLAVGPTTAFWLIKHGHRLLRKSSAGRVLLVSSLSADHDSHFGLSIYSMAKGAINALVRGAALELAEDRITVNAVAPGGTMSASFAAVMSPDAIEDWEKSVPLGRIGQGRDIANAMLFLASDDGEYVTGQTLIVDGGQSLGTGREIR